MIGLDNPIHLLLLGVILLLVFGAKRLPEMGRSLGAGLRGFKESISGEESLSGEMPDQPASPLSLQRTEPVATATDEQAVPATSDAAEQRRAA